MTREQLLQIARATPNIGAVKHEEFVDYIVALSQRKKGDDGWQTVEHPYMTVDGKLAMANQDHLRQNKRLDFNTPQILVDNEDQLTLMVTVTSEIYGTRHGIATSRRVGGTSAEREFPWEVAETSAIGRALSTMGYGMFPGSGLASAEDMMRVNGNNVERRGGMEGEQRGAPAANLRASTNEPRATYSRGVGGSATKHPPLSPVQRNKLTELWRILHPGSDEQIAEGLEKLFVDSFKHGMTEATYEEGARLTGQLLSELRNKTNTPAAQ